MDLLIKAIQTETPRQYNTKNRQFFRNPCFSGPNNIFVQYKPFAPFLAHRTAPHRTVLHRTGQTILKEMTNHASKNIRGAFGRPRNPGNCQKTKKNLRITSPNCHLHDIETRHHVERWKKPKSKPRPNKNRTATNAMRFEMKHRKQTAPKNRTGPRKTAPHRKVQYNAIFSRARLALIYKIGFK